MRRLFYVFGLIFLIYARAQWLLRRAAANVHKSQRECFFKLIAAARLTASGIAGLPRLEGSALRNAFDYRSYPHFVGLPLVSTNIGFAE
jgi:hypothetical protein